MAPQKPNDGRHIDDIINRTICGRHYGDKGIACFYVFLDTKNGEASPAVCGSRISKAGFNGIITPNSLSRTLFNGKPRTRE